MKPPNLLDRTRRDLVDEVAATAIRLRDVERRIAEFKELATLAGYDLIHARLEHRDALDQLEAHDVRRSEDR